MLDSTMAIHQNNTTTAGDSDGSFHLQNDGIQPPLEDKPALADFFFKLFEAPFCFDTDPLLLPTFQEVSKEQYFQYETSRKKKRKTSLDSPPHDIVAPSPTSSPVLKSDPSQKKIQPWEWWEASTTPVAHQSLTCYLTEEQDLTTRNDQGVGRTIVQDNKNDRTPQGGYSNKKTRRISQTPPPETTRKPTKSPGYRELPKHFVPKPWSVVLGRDRASLRAPGNHQLRRIVHQHLERYTKCGDNKIAKTKIISEIESTIRRNNRSKKKVSQEGEEVVQQGAFIKFQDGRWWEVTPSDAREKIGRLLRESLHTKYSSSSKRKRARLQQQQRLKLMDTKKQKIPSS